MKKEDGSRKNNKKIIIRHVMLSIILIIAIFPSFLFKNLGKLDLSQIMFLLLSDGAGADMAIAFDFIRYTFVRVLIFNLIIFGIKIIYDRKWNEEGSLSLVLKRLKDKLPRVRLLTNFAGKFLLVGLALVLFLNSQFDVSGFIASSRDLTYIYEENYVDPNDVKFEFPERKRNIVRIYLESMNTNYEKIDIDNLDEPANLIPGLKELFNDNVSFSNTEDFGGFQHLKGLTWTVASLVGQTSGVPLNVPMKRNKYGSNGYFLPGIKTSGEILNENGYDNYFLMGSDADFGGRETYFRSHGGYTIYDTKYLKEIGYIPEDYDVFWGMEDLKLFDVAKTKLSEISKGDKPFNFSILTVDSHYPKGYVDETCELNYEDKYANAISCSDLKVIEFVEWLKEQDFYENTTIVITGDHNTMNKEFLSRTHGDVKTIYNTFLNLPFNVNEDVLVNRGFSALDMFPTTLAALGIKIEGNRLGLGVNLFSGDKTLIEDMGINEINKEFSKTSNYYNSKFFGETKEKTTKENVGELK